MNNSKFKTMSFDEMSKIQAGWKLFGKETKNGDVHGSIAGNAFSTDQTTTTYVFGIPASSHTTQITDGWD